LLWVQWWWVPNTPEPKIQSVEDGQDRIEKDVDEIKGDVKSIEQMIQQHYGVGDTH